ncbi:MAG: hypothetical protein ABL899_02710, partial [Nitrospira sp.]
MQLVSCDSRLVQVSAGNGSCIVEDTPDAIARTTSMMAGLSEDGEVVVKKLPAWYLDETSDD